MLQLRRHIRCTHDNRLIRSDLYAAVEGKKETSPTGLTWTELSGCRNWRKTDLNGIKLQRAPTVSKQCDGETETER